MDFLRGAICPLESLRSLSNIEVLWEVEWEVKMTTPVIGALAALAGSIVGGCASVAATLVGQRMQVRGARLAAELDEHEELYGRFVEKAVQLFIEAIERSGIDPGKVMQLYSLVARIRLTSGDDVLRAAEEVGKRLLGAYELPPDDTMAVLARYANGDQTLDPLRDFTEACRRERARTVQTISSGFISS